MIGKVKIGPLEYQVALVPDLHDLVDDKVKQRLFGWVKDIEQLIQINTDAAQDRQKITLIHEIMHGILNNADISDHAEHQISLLAFGIVAVLRDNPDLVKFLLE